MGSQIDLSELSIDQAMRFALYETHRFCIRLPPEASLLDDFGANRSVLDTNTLAIFVHEYTHFWHNISTVCGWGAFELFIQVLAHFSRALDSTGHCRPDSLTDAERQGVQDAIRALNLLEGTRSFPKHPSHPESLKVLDVLSRTEIHLEVPFAQRVVRWEVTRRDGSIDVLETAIGAFLIEEGIAYLLETFIRRGQAAFDESWTAGNGPPLFPYLAYQILCRSRAPEISAAAAVKIGLLALNYNRPGEALMRTLSAYQALRLDGMNDEEACLSLRRSVAPSLAETSKRVREESLPQLTSLFKNRGRLATGISQIQQWFHEGLSARERDIWFDIVWCSGASLNTDALSRMLQESTPCDVIQTRAGLASDVGRDALITFSRAATGLSHEVLSGVRTFQAQLDFLLSHLTTSALVPTTQGSGRGCPYFTVCTLRMRTEDSEVCVNQPWTRWSEDPTCWYGAAVAGTLGIVEQHDELPVESAT